MRFIVLRYLAVFLIRDMKEFKDLKVGDELILLYSYSQLSLDYSIFKITNINKKDDLINIKGISDEIIYYTYVRENQVINEVGIYLYDKYGDRVDDFEFIRTFNNLKDCKRYAVSNILKNIREQERQLNSVILWE